MGETRAHPVLSLRTTNHPRLCSISSVCGVGLKDCPRTNGRKNSWQPSKKSHQTDGQHAEPRLGSGALTERRHGFDWLPTHIVGPCLHHPAAFGEQVSAPIGGLDPVLDDMGQSHLRHVPWKARCSDLQTSRSQPANIQTIPDYLQTALESRSVGRRRRWGGSGTLHGHGKAVQGVPYT